MSQFRYRALDAEGLPHLGVVEAPTWEAAEEYLTTLGLHTVSAGGPGDKRWAREQNFRQLREQLNWPKFLRFLVFLSLVGGLLLAVGYVATRREIEVSGTYHVQGPRGPLKLCFFVDGKVVYPTKKRTQLSQNQFRCQLIFRSFKKPQRIQARLRMPGHSDASHRAVPIEDQSSLQLPPLTLRKQGANDKNGKLPW